MVHLEAQMPLVLPLLQLIVENRQVTRRAESGYR
jgi:hypothetical protein